MRVASLGAPLGSMSFVLNTLSAYEEKEHGRMERAGGIRRRGIAYREKRAPARAGFVLPSLLPFSRPRRTRRPTAT